MKPTWTSEARRDLSDKLRQHADGELMHIFRAANPTEIIVKQRFRGFSDEPEKKLIIAVEILSPTNSSAHVVKLGNTDDVAGDCQAWEQCAQRRGVASRLFIAPISGPVSEHRQATIYPDVYQYYFDNGRADQPSELEAVVDTCIQSDVPASGSIERVLSQVYTEAFRCFYHSAKEDPSFEAVDLGVKNSLRYGQSNDVLALWQQPTYVGLRRGAAWLTCCSRKPDSLERPLYVDPVDYAAWAIEHRKYPKMLVGSAHGDLHGRNVIVGTVRGEAEWPAVFDFDKMADKNLIAWDFAKLELELKCRLFQQLIDSEEERAELRSILRLPQKPPFPDSIQLTGEERRIGQRVELMEIMFAIERLLDDWTKQISSRSRATKLDAAFEPDISASTALGRAVRIIARIRKEAALFLGFERGRENYWQDEYYFALATYGVVTAKWHSADDHLAWALLSAGVACANLSQLPWPPDSESPPDVSQVPSHLHLLPYAYRCWNERDRRNPDELLDRGITSLREGIVRFPHAIVLKEQLALLLSTTNQPENHELARREVEPLYKLACVFRDHELLSRLGRIYKDRADRLCDGSFTHAEMLEGALPAFQAYQASLKYYKLAYDFSHDYYPGINAATLALLVGDHELKNQLANEVLAICSQLPLDRVDQEWILASEGEACLLLGNIDRAKHFYSHALDRLLPSETGKKESMAKQIRRIGWPTHPKPIASLEDLFH